MNWTLGSSGISALLNSRGWAVLTATMSTRVLWKQCSSFFAVQRLRMLWNSSWGILPLASHLKIIHLWPSFQSEIKNLPCKKDHHSEAWADQGSRRQSPGGGPAGGPGGGRKVAMINLAPRRQQSCKGLRTERMFFLVEWGCRRLFYFHAVHCCMKSYKKNVACGRKW